MKKIIFTFVIAALALSGCRRTDVREMTVEFESLSDANKDAVVKILSVYDGVDKGSFVWDVPAKKLNLKYDSMKIAQANIRYAIDEKGIKVKFPKKTDDHAGY